MIVTIVAAVLLATLIVVLHGQVSAQLEAIAQRVARVERALNADEERRMFIQARSEGVEGNIVERLERIEAAVDPVARARHDVRRVLDELDEALREDDANGYAHWKANNIKDQIDRGERPERGEWETWIRTPFPWS